MTRLHKCLFKKLSSFSELMFLKMKMRHMRLFRSPDSFQSFDEYFVDIQLKSYLPLSFIYRAVKFS